jgi:hypothetical protein
MKMKYLIATVLLCTMITMNCNASFFGLVDDNNEGNGIIKSVNRNDFENFNSINIDGAFTIKINVTQSRNFAKIIGDSNLLSLMTTTVKDNTLYIKAKDKYNTKSKIIIYINAKALNSLKINGKNIVTITGVNSKTFSLKQSGVNKITLAGRTDNLKLYSTDIGKIYANNLKAKNADISLFDASTAKTYVTNNLIANVRDAGIVTYYGNPLHINNLNKWVNNNIVAG